MRYLESGLGALVSVGGLSQCFLLPLFLRNNAHTHHIRVCVIVDRQCPYDCRVGEPDSARAKCCYCYYILHKQRAKDQPEQRKSSIYVCLRALIYMCVLAFGHCTPNAMVSAWCKWQWWCHLQCVVPVVHGVLSVLKCACVYCSTTHVLVRLHSSQHAASSNEHWAMRQFQHTGTAASSAPHDTGQRGRQPGWKRTYARSSLSWATRARALQTRSPWHPHHWWWWQTWCWQSVLVDDNAADACAEGVKMYVYARYRRV